MTLLTQVQKPCFGKPELSGDDDCRICHKYLRMACDLLVDTKIREKEAVWLAERINPAELCGGCNNARRMNAGCARATRSGKI